MIAAALVALLAAAPADGPTAPGAILSPMPRDAPAGAAATPEPVASPSVRVERRLLRKEEHLFLSGGPAYLARGDYYTSPGLALSATYYVAEWGGLEVRLAPFVSRLDAAAREVQDQTGLVPDARRPVTLVTAGWRQSVAYGKVLPGEAVGVVHFDLQGAAGAGVLFTDAGPTAALFAGPGLLARLGGRGVAQLDVQLTLSFEERLHAAVSTGVLATITVGGWL